MQMCVFEPRHIYCGDKQTALCGKIFFPYNKLL